MNIDDVLLIASLVVSLVALVVTLISLPPRHRVVAAAAATVAILGVTTGVSIYRSQVHERLIGQVQAEITEILASDSMTFDELHQQLLQAPV